MARSTSLTLITWLSRSKGLRRLTITFPIVFAATAAEAPLVQSAPIAATSDAPASKSTDSSISAPDNSSSPGNDPISLLHSNASSWLSQTTFAAPDTPMVKTLLTPPPLSPPGPTIPYVPVAITNASPTPSTAQFDPTGQSGSDLITRDFTDSGVDSSEAVEPVEPISAPNTGNFNGNVGTALVPEPSTLWMLPVIGLLLRRRRSMPAYQLVSAR